MQFQRGMSLPRRTRLLPLCVLAGAALLTARTATAGPGAVIYLADQDTDGVVELYRADLKIGAVARVSAPLVAGGTVSDFEISR